MAAKRKKRQKITAGDPPKGTYHNLSDLLKMRGHGTPYEFGRALYKYIDCGPWTVFRVPGLPKGTVYYEDPLATELSWTKDCTAIQIGSIVEGSAVEIGPETLEFPFTAERLDQTLAAINEEASFYWQRDNSRYFTVLDAGGQELFHAEWAEFAEGPSGDFSDAQAPLARQAGEFLFAAQTRLTGAVAIPDTDVFVREDDTPDLTY